VHELRGVRANLGVRSNCRRGRRLYQRQAFGLFRLARVRDVHDGRGRNVRGVRNSGGPLHSTRILLVNCKGLIGLSLLALWTKGARAESAPHSLRLEWARVAGAEACPSPARVHEVVEGLLNDFGSKVTEGRAIEGYFAPRAGGFAAYVRVLEANEVQQRELLSETEDCESLLAPTALAIALGAIDEERAPPTAPRASAAVSEPTASEAVGASATLTIESGAIVGMSPDPWPEIGFRADLGFRDVPLSLRASGRLLIERAVGIESGAFAFSAVLFGVGTCWSMLADSETGVELGLCAEVKGGLFFPAGRGAVRPMVAGSLALADVEVAFEPSWQIVGPLVVGLSLGLGVPFLTPNYSAFIENNPDVSSLTVYRAEPIYGRFAGQLGVRWR
jgi:hypothetical protein